MDETVDSLLGEALRDGDVTVIGSLRNGKIEWNIDVIRRNGSLACRTAGYDSLFEAAGITVRSLSGRGECGK